MIPGAGGRVRAGQRRQCFTWAVLGEALQVRLVLRPRVAAVVLGLLALAEAIARLAVGGADAQNALGVCLLALGGTLPLALLPPGRGGARGGGGRRAGAGPAACPDRGRGGRAADRGLAAGRPRDPPGRAGAGRGAGAAVRGARAGRAAAGGHAGCVPGRGAGGADARGGTGRDHPAGPPRGGREHARPARLSRRRWSSTRPAASGPASPANCTTWSRTTSR